MSKPKLELRYDPNTIDHLGVKMYSFLPPAIAEIISNAYDADASEVHVRLTEEKGIPKEIVVSDNGHGMTFSEIQENFLVIGRNRRESGDTPTPKHKRFPTGKKGLGKLALFGIAEKITIKTAKNGLENEFSLDWAELKRQRSSYAPEIVGATDRPTKNSGTMIVLTNLKRKTAFDDKNIMDSLSRIFWFGSDFKVTVSKNRGQPVQLNNERRYESLDQEFTWDIQELLGKEYPGISGTILTTKKPIPPSLSIRGVILASRGKMVNAAEAFSESTSSHFFEYLTGWINVDFIDQLPEDVISTNRQSLNWEHPDTLKLRRALEEMVAKIHQEWRTKRKQEKIKELSTKTDIDVGSWISTMTGSVRENTEKIVNILSGEDAIAQEKFAPVIEAVHQLVPEYPHLHWRYLNGGIRDRVKKYYTGKMYGDAAIEAIKIYVETIQKKASRSEDGEPLMDTVFSMKPEKPPIARLPILAINSLNTDTEASMQMGHYFCSKGLIKGFRNPFAHTPIDSIVPSVFSEKDCLDILSLVSHLMGRVEHAMVNPQPATPAQPAAPAVPSAPLSTSAGGNAGNP